MTGGDARTRAGILAWALIACSCLLLRVGEPVHAGPLRPDELLLMYNAGDKDSAALAEYYARARGVPADRLLGLTLRSPNEEISQDEYEKTVRGPALAHLELAGLREKVRCLVTFYGLPIRVGKQPLTQPRARLLAKWRVEFKAALEEYRSALGEIEPAATRPAGRRGVTAPDAAEFYQLQQQYLKARVAFFEAARARSSESEGQTRFAKLIDIMKKVEGLAGLTTQLNVTTAGPRANPVADRFEAMREKVRADELRINEVMARGVDDPARDQARALVREDYGLTGLLLSLDKDIALVREDETEAAVDSELALLWWGEYPRYRWVGNAMNWRLRAEDSGRPPPPAPALMVSRIDGTRPGVARGLIDKALAGEKAGPNGKVYIDARGLAAQQPGYGPYDEYLRKLAEIVRANTPLEVRLDNREQLFGRGDCPDTLLYCGWYSVRKYVDAFTYAPGAVGYHLASFEAVTLKRAGEQGWCKRMLDDGITATLGPVAEPYLQSFPRPDDFFGLLLTGRFTLAETYAYTTPFYSWMQMLIGDPLYRPFGASAPLKLEQAVPAEIIPPEFRPGTKPG